MTTCLFVNILDRHVVLFDVVQAAGDRRLKRFLDHLGSQEALGMK